MKKNVSKRKTVSKKNKTVSKRKTVPKKNVEQLIDYNTKININDTIINKIFFKNKKKYNIKKTITNKEFKIADLYKSNKDPNVVLNLNDIYVISYYHYYGNVYKLPDYIVPIDENNDKLFNHWFSAYYLLPRDMPKNKKIDINNDNIYIFVYHRGTDESSIKNILVNVRNILPVVGETKRSLYAKDGIYELTNIFSESILKKKLINFGFSQGAVYANKEGNNGLITIVFNPAPYVNSAWGKKPTNLIQIKNQKDIISYLMNTEDNNEKDNIYVENITISYKDQKLKKIDLHSTLSLKLNMYPVLTKKKIEKIFQLNIEGNK